MPRLRLRFLVLEAALLAAALVCCGCGCVEAAAGDLWGALGLGGAALVCLGMMVAAASIWRDGGI
jgi:hypothetical protein